MPAASHLNGLNSAQRKAVAHGEAVPEKGWRAGPLLVIAGANDDLAPPASVRPAFVRSYAADKTYRALPLGHIDLLVGRAAPRLTWALVTDWLRARAA